MNPEIPEPNQPQPSRPEPQVITPSTQPADQPVVLPNNSPPVYSSPATYGAFEPGRKNGGLKKVLLVTLGVMIVLGGAAAAFMMWSQDAPADDERQSAVADTEKTDSAEPITSSPNSVQAAVQKFVTGIQKSDKAAVDATTGDYLQDLTRELAKSSSLTFYDACQDERYELYCQETFQGFDANQAASSVEDATLKNGKSGKLIRFAKRDSSRTEGSTTSGESYYEFQMGSYGDKWKVEIYEIGFNMKSEGSTRIEDTP